MKVYGLSNKYFSGVYFWKKDDAENFLMDTRRKHKGEIVEADLSEVYISSEIRDRCFKTPEDAEAAGEYMVLTRGGCNPYVIRQWEDEDGHVGIARLA